MAAAVLTDAVLVDALPGDVRVAVLAGGEVTDIVVDRAAHPSVAGDIYWGRVSALAPQIDAAFVDVGLDRAGFLGAADVPGTGRIGDRLTEGQAILVQVLADPRDDAGGAKGAKLTAKPTLPGRTVVLTPGDGQVRVSKRLADPARRAALTALLRPLTADADTGFVVRTGAADADDVQVADEARALAETWRRLGAAAVGSRPPACLYRDDAVARAGRRAAPGAPVWVSAPDAAAALAGNAAAHPWTAAQDLFAAHGVDAALEDALASEVALPGGGRLAIEPTAALTAIDVNVGTADAGGAQATAMAVNREAVAAIAAQLRLRNLGGLFVVDFLRLKDKGDRAKILAALRAAGAADPEGLNVVGETALGLVEMTRPRRHPALGETMAGAAAPATAAFDGLRRVLRESRHRPGVGFVLTAAPDVAAALDGEAADARRAVEARLHRPVDIAVDPAMLPGTLTLTESSR